MNRIDEILLILQEECAEVIQAVSKIKRFGMSDNQAQLKTELADLQCMIDLVYEYNVIPSTYEERLDRIFEKRQKLKKFSRIFDEAAPN